MSTIVTLGSGALRRNGASRKLFDGIRTRHFRILLSRAALRSERQPDDPLHRPRIFNRPRMRASQRSLISLVRSRSGQFLMTKLQTAERCLSSARLARLPARSRSSATAFEGRCRSWLDWENGGSKYRVQCHTPSPCLMTPAASQSDRYVRDARSAPVCATVAVWPWCR